MIGGLIDRGVIQAGALFLVVGWLLIQVADAVVPILGLPGWAKPFVTYVVIGGFPVVVLLSWFFEFAEGRFYLDRGKDSPTITTGLEKNYLTVVIGYLLASGGALIYQFAVGFNVVGNPLIVADEIVASDVVVQQNSIAVLRFMNIDGSERSEIFSHGFAEDVLDQLARVPGLHVSARGDSWSLPVNSKSEDIRKRLRVAYYLEGSVRLVDNDLRVVAQLIDSETGFHVVSRSFDRKLENFVEVQDEITDLTVANLRVALPEETQMPLARNYSGTDLDAYILYRQGRELQELPTTQETLSGVIHHYQSALVLDPDYAAAHAGLCSTYVLLYVVTKNDAEIESAEKACAAGLAANSNLHMVYTALGDLYEQTGRIGESERAFLQAISFNAQDVRAMQGLASVYERQQRLDEATALLDKAIRLQPGNWRSISTLGGLLFSNGRFAEAAQKFRDVVALDPGNQNGLGNLGSALLMTGDFAGAADALQKSLDIEPDRDYFSNLALIYYYQGEFDKSVEIHRAGVADSADQNSVWLNLGDALRFSSTPDEAEAAFRRSAELADSVLNVNPMNTMIMYELAWATAMLGDTARARELIDRSMALDPDNPYVHYYDALLDLHVGNSALAIDALRTTIGLGYPPVLLTAEPYLAELRDNQEFQNLLSNTD